MRVLDQVRVDLVVKFHGEYKLSPIPLIDRVEHPLMAGRKRPKTYDRETGRPPRLQEGGRLWELELLNAVYHLPKAELEQLKRRAI